MTMTKKNTAGLATAAAKTAVLTNANGGAPAKHILRTSLLVSALGWASLASAQGISGIGAFVPNTELGFTPVAKAGDPRINWINGEYQESNTDLSVKVLGGSLDIARSWSQGRWWLNPAWAPLSFELDPLGSDAKVIERVGVLYERSGQSDLYMAKSKGNAPVYIKRLKGAAGQHTGWQWYDRFGNTIHYSPDGVIQSYANASGVKVSFAYDSATSARILDHFDKTIYTVTMAGGLITKVEDLAGRSISYQWAGQRLAQVTDVMGHAWKYEYDANGQITSRTDPLGLKISAQYIQSIPAPEPMLSLGKKGVTIDPTGTSGTTQKLANLWGGGRVGQFDGQSGCASTGANNYLRERRVFEVTYTDCRGNATVTQYDLQGNELSRTFNGKKTASNQWDGAYSQKYTNARGYSTTTTYDSNYQPLQITHPDGSVEKYTYEPVFGRQSSYTNQLGVVSTWRYDSKGNVTEWIEAKDTLSQKTITYTYDQYSLLEKELVSKNGDAEEAQAHLAIYSHDTSGNVVSVINAEGNLTKITYDAVGNLIHTADALGRITTYMYNARGQLTSKVSPMGNIISMEYDSIGLMEKLINPMGHDSRFVYDKYGRIKQKIDPEGNAQNFEYNSVGELVKSISAEGVEKSTVYDEEGRVKAESDGNGNIISYIYGEKGSVNSDLLLSINYPGGLVVSNQYDQLGRRTVSVKKSGKEAGEEIKTVSIYDSIGRKVATTNANGKTKRTEYDSRNRPIKKIDENNNELIFEYDVLDNVVKVTDPNGNEYNYYFNKLNILQEAHGSNGEVTKYEYDVVGNFVKAVNPDGDVIEINYDDDGRKIKETKKSHVADIQKKAVLSQVINYKYDDAGRIVYYEQLDGMGGLISSASYTLDALGRNKKENISYGRGVNFVNVEIAQNWNRDGQKTDISYPNGDIFRFSYNKGLLKKATLPGDNGAIDWESYIWNLSKSIKYPGVQRENTYDGFFRNRSINVVKSSDVTHGVLGLNYEYDVVGNVKKIDRQIGADFHGSTDYSYDDLGRITKVIPSSEFASLGLPEENYSYDALGNRKSSMHQPGDWIYEKGNRLVQWGREQQRISYQYSASGNLISEATESGVKRYEYNAAERIIKIEDEKNILARYQYDPMNRRISKTIASGTGEKTIWFIYGEDGLLAELDGKQHVTKTYGWEPNTRWGMRPLWQADHSHAPVDSTYHYIHVDHLGTPQVTTDKDGGETWRMVAEGFGKERVSGESVVEMNLRFPGQYRDIETDSNYNLHRDYNPSTGRYLQADPIGLLGGLNYYEYAVGNAISLHDNLGLESCSPWVVLYTYYISRTEEKPGKWSPWEVAAARHDQQDKMAYLICSFARDRTISHYIYNDRAEVKERQCNGCEAKKQNKTDIFRDEKGSLLSEKIEDEYIDDVKYRINFGDMSSASPYEKAWTGMRPRGQCLERINSL